MRIASWLTIACSAGSLLVLWLPYVEVFGASYSLLDTTTYSGSNWAVAGPRLVGTLLAAGAAGAGLRDLRWRAGAWCAAGATLLGLALFDMWQAAGFTIGSHQIGWYLDLLVSFATVLVVAVGIAGVDRWLASAPRALYRRPLASAPFVAVAGAALGVVITYLLSRNPRFLVAFSFGSGSIIPDGVPVAMRASALVSALLMVALPVLAALAPERRIAAGVGLGWFGFVAVGVAGVLVPAAAERVSVGAHFVVGVVLIVLAAPALVAWALFAGRQPAVGATPASPGP